MIVRFGDRWLFIATWDVDGRNAESTALRLRSAPTIAALAHAPEHEILGLGVAGIDGCFWAPELHQFGGTLHVFFAPSAGTRDWRSVRAFVMSLRPGGDPTDAGDWGVPRPVLRADDTPIEPNGISLDMTSFALNGTRYAAWSQRVTEPALGDAGIWIATIDPARPHRLTSQPRRIVSPDLAWERATAAVVEGPFAVLHGDTVVLTYSGSGVDESYAVGAVRASVFSDLTDPNSWEKSPKPLLESDPDAGEWGPGHGSFCIDEDGTLLYVYHAMTAPGRRGRATGIAEVRWVDGWPRFDR